MKKYIFFTVIICIMVLLNLKIKAQTTQSSNLPLAGTDHLGWNATSFPTVTSLDIATRDVGANAIPIDFYTNNTLFLQLLTTGDLNVVVGTNAYEISNQPVLWHNGNATDIFVGVGAGIAGTSGGNNTLVGNNAGGAATFTGPGNVIIGSGAGSSLTTSQENVFVGMNAGLNQTSNFSYHNVFVGFEAGRNTNGTAFATPGRHNSFFGDDAGEYNVTGTDNTYLGAHCAQLSGTNNGIGANHVVAIGMFAGLNNEGDDNVFVGHSSGYWTISPVSTIGNNSFFGINSGITNVTGEECTILGANADVGAIGLINAAAIGANAKVMQPDNMILGGDIAGMNDVRVGIGLSGNAAGAQYKLDVLNTVPDSHSNDIPIAGNFYETGTPTTPGSDFDAVVGKIDVAQTGSGGTNYGGDFSAGNADNNIGVRGIILQNNSSGIGVQGNAVCSVSSIGVDGSAKGGTTNIGVQSTVNPNIAAANKNIGVYSTVIPAPGIPAGSPIAVYGGVKPIGAPFGAIAVYGDLGPAGAGPPCGPWPSACVPAVDLAGYFNGDVVTTSAMFHVSDENLKENIQDIPNALDIVNQLNPKWYSFRQEQNASMELPLGSHYGLISQDLELVLPGLVKDCTHPARYDSAGNQTYAAINFKAINYTELIPLLLAGMKQQQNQIADLQAALSSHRASPPQDNNQEQDQNQTKPNAPIDITLSSKTIVLNDAVPNPFKEQATISYFIPDDAKNVKMIFTDSRGNVMKEVSIPEKGNGQLNVYAQDLSSGIYTYTLVADGVTIDSKKMVCNK